MAKFKPKNIDDSGEGGTTLGVTKAKTILKDGTVRGKAISKKQKGFFGAIAGGTSKAKGAAPKMAKSAASQMDSDTKKYGAMMKGKK
jgi:hypothetical protein